MIEAKQVRYGIRSREILRGVDFRVEKGEFVGLIGPNGSGKSTFLKNVYKVLRPQAGELTLMGDDLLAMSNREMAQRLAVMVQEQEAAFDFTVEEVVMMGRQARKRLLETDSREDRALVGEILAHTGLASLREQGFSTLSGGEKQRVLIARALAQQTAVLVLDEPTYTFVWDLGDVGIGLMTIFNIAVILPMSKEALGCLREYEGRLREQR